MKNSMLETDLYTLTMVLNYFTKGKHNDNVTFEGFVRKLPAQRNFLIFAGLESLLDTLETWNLSGEEVAYLKGLAPFKGAPEGFWSYLKDLKFTATVSTPREGTVLFENEPFVSITGHLGQVQLVETLVLNILNYSMAVASKAARIRIAAGEKAILAEFGFRRAAGPDAALLASRAAFVGGFNSTSNVSAGYEFGMPLSGTMAHSFILSYATEEEAFKSYKETYGEQATALIDTYDPILGTKNALKTFGKGLVGVRLDSGDKIVLSREIRRILNEAGNTNTRIIVSDDMNESKIKINKMTEAPIDGYGVGTELVNPGPLGGVYKLVEYQGQPKAKNSEGKLTYPGKKQVFRQYDSKGMWLKDTIGMFDETIPFAKKLLNVVMQDGYKMMNSLVGAQEEMYVNLQRLPDKYLSLDNVYSANVEFSEKLRNLTEQTMRNKNG